MNNYINEDLREFVSTRADHICEYCLIHEEDTFFKCQVDHIISLKHGGQTEENNLAYACIFCNRNKGSDVGSIFFPSNEFVRLFNPRIDKWGEHFKLDGAVIVPLTKIGNVTAKILGFNENNRILERQSLIVVSRYPSKSALKRMQN